MSGRTTIASMSPRSALVEQAFAIANETVGVPAGHSFASGARWTAEFVRQMERLSAPLLNGNGNHGNGVKPGAHERNRIKNVEMSADPAVTGPRPT